MTSKKLMKIIKEAQENAKKNNIQVQDRSSFILGWLVSALLWETSDIKKLADYDVVMASQKRNNLWEEAFPIYEQH